MKNIKILFTLSISMLSFPALAELYKSNVKRLEQNIYKVTSSDIIIKTKYCYVYTYGDDVIIDTSSKKIIFINQNQSCDIDAII